MFKERAPDYMLGPLVVRQSDVKGAGLGVFATADIPKGQFVERSPVLFFHEETLKTLEEFGNGNHILGEYVFRWMPGRIFSGQLVVCWGYGCLYNHSDEANIMFQYREGKLPAMEFFSTRDIAAGEELFIRYLPKGTGLWFETSARSIDAMQNEWYGEGWDEKQD